MKKIILYSLLFGCLAIKFTACRKDDVQTPPDLRFPLPLLTKDTTGDDFISGKDPASFLGKFIVDMYYGTVTAQKVDVVVIRNDNKANVRTIKANVTSFPASIEVTGTQLTTLFDSTINLGDKFEIGADVTTINGQKFEAFPATEDPYGADTSALPGSRFSIVYFTTCRFDISSFAGWYTVVSNTIGEADWGDLKAGDGVPVSAGEDAISVYAYPLNQPQYIIYPMVCQVDPVTFDIAFQQQMIGLNTTFSWPMIWVESGKGAANPCGDAITITLNMTLFTAYYHEGILYPSYSQAGVLELRK
jgi:hypothetical protein